MTRAVRSDDYLRNATVYEQPRPSDSSHGRNADVSPDAMNCAILLGSSRRIALRAAKYQP